MSKATDLAARAARLAERSETKREDMTEPESSTVEAQAPDRAPRATRRATPRATPVRVTADLAPQSYRALIAYSAELAERFGRAKVPHVEIIRALVDRLEGDPALREAISEDVRMRISN